MTTNLEIAMQAALETGDAIMNVYDTAFDIEYKEDKSPLTEAIKKQILLLKFKTIAKV